MIILGVVPAIPAVPYWRVKAVSVKWPDGTKHMVWGAALARLGIDHPEVIAQLTKP